MATELTQPVCGALAASGRALTSAELASRVRQPREAVEAVLEAARSEPRLVVCEWPVADPHFGLERILVAAWVAEPDATARYAAEERCRQVYDEILRDFLASHRCV